MNVIPQTCGQGCQKVGYCEKESDTHPISGGQGRALGGDIHGCDHVLPLTGLEPWASVLSLLNLTFLLKEWAVAVIMEGHKISGSSSPDTRQSAFPLG